MLSESQRTVAEKRNVTQWLQAGIAAAQSGQQEEARYRLLDVVEQDQTNETAWYWLYQVSERADDKRICLENLVLLNPNNQWAKQQLLNYLDSAAPNAERRRKAVAKKAERPAAPRPIPLKLITAFWVGISFIFLGSGIISAGDWLLSVSRSRGFPYTLTIPQFLELLITISFITSGVLGFFIAITLFSRSMIGFYGSLLLALGLLLIGPTVSLISNPPNYLALTCTGGISGMIVLLTLASQSGFRTISHDDKPSN
jgi:hypothetical protein